MCQRQDTPSRSSCSDVKRFREESNSLKSPFSVALMCEKISMRRNFGTKRRSCPDARDVSENNGSRLCGDFYCRGNVSGISFFVFHFPLFTPFISRFIFFQRKRFPRLFFGDKREPCFLPVELDMFVNGVDMEWNL